MNKLTATALGLGMAAALLAGCDDRIVVVGGRITVRPGNSNPSSPAPTPAPDAGPPNMACAPGTPAPVRAVTLAPAELARRLARVLWSGGVDAELERRAMAVRTTADVAALARTMLQDPRSQGGAEALGRSWLKTGDVLTGPTIVSPEMRRSMYVESSLFLHELLTGMQTDLRTLLTAGFTFADEPLARDYYGRTAGPTHSRISVDPAQRGGVLTQPGFSVTNAHATRRGAWVNEAFLCRLVPPPPADVDLSLEVPMGKTYRQALTEKTNQPVCTLCHAITDGIGFTLEHYAPSGHHVSTDNGQPIDSSTVLQGTRDLDGVAVANAMELGRALAGSCQVQECVATHFAQHALGRSPDREMRDVREAQHAFVTSNGDLRELLVAVVQMPSFLAP